MTAQELMQGLLVLTCGITAAAISFQIGRVWEQHNTRIAMRRANLYRITAEERIEEAEREIAAITAEREAMREVASEWNRILEKARGHQITQRIRTSAGDEVRGPARHNPGLSRPH